MHKSGCMAVTRYNRNMTRGRPAMYSVLSRKAFATIVFLSLLIVMALPGISEAFDIGLVEPEALSQSLSAWTILDARPKKEWGTGHIPGAISFSWENYTRTDEKGIPYRTLAPHQLAEALTKLGVDEKTPLIVYGDADTSWGGEGWACWVFAWIGHQGKVRLLNGGIQAWTGKGLSVKTGAKNLNKAASVYHYQINPSLNISAQEIRNDPSSYQLVDTRSTFEWIKGRIPDSVHISWEKFFTGKNRHHLSSSELKTLLAGDDINPDRTVVYYCTGGIRSGYAWLVHCLAGLPQAINFEGGTAEWDKSVP